MTSDKIFNTLLSTAMDKTGEAAELAYAIYQMLEGDDIGYERGSELLEKYGYLNEDGEWKYGEDD